MTVDITNFSNLLGFANLNVALVLQFNAVTIVLGLVTITYLDPSAFSEHLTVFGIIGEGIALALAQCEAAEGCAPNVDENELQLLIEGLNARLKELEIRLLDETDEASKKELEDLAEGFKEEIENYKEYLEQLQEINAELEEQDEDLDEDLEELLEEGVKTDASEIARFAKALETVNARINWLEGLKANPRERARLSEATGMDLTIEVLDEIIEGAKTEALYFEQQIKLLLEGTEASVGPGYQFVADARSYDDIETIHYGPPISDESINTPFKEFNLY